MAGSVLLTIYQLHPQLRLYYPADMAPVSPLIWPYSRQPRRRLRPPFALGSGGVRGSRLAAGGLSLRQADGVSVLGEGKPSGSKGW